MKKWIFLLVVLCLSADGYANSRMKTNNRCVPGRIDRYSLKFQSYKTGYYPHDSSMEGGYVDRVGNPLHTLQNYLRGRSPYVSVSMDKYDTRFPYGAILRIPDLERAYGRCILFKVVDTGGNFEGQRERKIDICHDSESHTIQPIHNGWSQIYRVN